MKKVFLCLLALTLLLTLAACGGKEERRDAAPVSLDGLYEEMAAAQDADLVQVPQTRIGKLFGVREEDCSQIIVALCAESVRADELWLAEAADEEAASRIEALAATRLEQRKEEMKNYLPDQYAVLCQAELLREGRYVALIVSPAAAQLAERFLQAVGG